MNAAPRPALARLEDEVAVHRPAQLARDVQAEAAAAVGPVARRRARTGRTAGRDPPRRRPARRRRSSAGIRRGVAVDGDLDARPAPRRRTSRRCRAAPTGPGRAGRRRRPPASRRRRRRASNGDVARRRAPPTPCGPAVASETTSLRGWSAPDSRRVTVSSWRTIRDSRSDCSAMIPRRRSGRSPVELLGVRADARQRRLEVVADAAQEVVLGRVELEQLRVLRLDRGEQLGVADRRRAISLANSSRRSWSARSQRRVAGRRPTSTPRSSPPARSTARTGSGLARARPPRPGPSPGRPGRPSQSIMPNAARASVAGRGDERLDAVARRRPRRSPRGSGRARGCGARGRRRAGCGSRRGGPARRRPATCDRASTGRRPRRDRRPARSPAAARSGRSPSDDTRPRSRSTSSDRRARTAGSARTVASTVPLARTAWPTRARRARTRPAARSPTTTRAERSARGTERRGRGRRGPHVAADPSPGRRRSSAAGGRDRPVDRHEPVADAAHGLEVDRPVRVELDLLAQAAHRDPDVGRVGVLGLGPAAGEQRLGRDGLAEVRGQGVEQARLGRGQLDDLRRRRSPRGDGGRASGSARATRLWRGTLSPRRRRTRLIRARSSG